MIPNISELKEKLIERLRPSGWADKLKAFIQSSDFDDILIKLWKARESGKRFTPPLRDVFTAFETTKISNLKVVIVGQD